MNEWMSVCALHEPALIKLINYSGNNLLSCKVFWVQTFCSFYVSLSLWFVSFFSPGYVSVDMDMALWELNASHWHRFMMPNASEHEVNMFPIESDKRCVNFLYWSYKKGRSISMWVCVCVLVAKENGKKGKSIVR